MKTISTLAMALSLAISLQACTTNPSVGVVKSSEVTAHSGVTLQHPVYRVNSQGESIPYQVSSNTAPESIAEDANVEQSMDDGQEISPTTGAGLSESTPMRQKVVSIIGNIIVACATSGYCW